MGPGENTKGSNDALGIPGWRLWYSDEGKPWATRWGTALTAEQIYDGCSMTLGGDDLADLRRQIRNQPDGDWSNVTENTEG